MELTWRDSRTGALLGGTAFVLSLIAMGGMLWVLLNEPMRVQELKADLAECGCPVEQHIGGVP